MNLIIVCEFCDVGLVAGEPIVRAGGCGHLYHLRCGWTLCERKAPDGMLVPVEVKCLHRDCTSMLTQEDLVTFKPKFGIYLDQPEYDRLSERNAELERQIQERDEMIAQAHLDLRELNERITALENDLAIKVADLGRLQLQLEPAIPLIEQEDPIVDNRNEIPIDGEENLAEMNEPVGNNANNIEVNPIGDINDGPYDLGGFHDVGNDGELMNDDNRANDGLVEHDSEEEVFIGEDEEFFIGDGNDDSEDEIAYGVANSVIVPDVNEDVAENHPAPDNPPQNLPNDEDLNQFIHDHANGNQANPINAQPPAPAPAPAIPQPAALPLGPDEREIVRFDHGPLQRGVFRYRPNNIMALLRASNIFYGNLIHNSLNHEFRYESRNLYLSSYVSVSKHDRSSVYHAFINGFWCIGDGFVHGIAREPIRHNALARSRWDASRVGGSNISARRLMMNIMTHIRNIPPFILLSIGNHDMLKEDQAALQRNTMDLVEFLLSQNVQRILIMPIINTYLAPDTARREAYRAWMERQLVGLDPSRITYLRIMEAVGDRVHPYHQDNAHILYAHPYIHLEMAFLLNPFLNW
ncbi:uncharacterized protein LOC135834811 isoform X2 [Planococcus citri]